MVDAHNAPNVMLEIGRLREITFRAAGGGTGKSVDIDEFDTCEVPFKQLIVWNETDKEIISSYRFILGRSAPHSATCRTPRRTRTPTPTTANTG